ncbi:MAG: carbon-nitrogen hydrolase family protein [Bacteriovoracia bacterium]
MMKKWIGSFGIGLALLASADDRIVPINEIFEPPPPIDINYAKVAVLQWAGAPTPVEVTPEVAEAFKQSNRDAIARYVREAAGKGAEWVVTPEFSIVGYPDIPDVPPEEDEFRNREDIRPYVETVPGPSTDFFGALARELKVVIHIGLAEVDPVTDQYFNTVVALGKDGAILAKYRKINLYQGETKFLSRGTEIATYDGEFGKVAIIICADVYSLDPMSKYRALGAKIYALSTSWAQMNTGMGHFTRAARSASAYLLAANQIYFPDSGVINPDGSTQSHIRQSSGLAYGYLPRVKPVEPSPVPPVGPPAPPVDPTPKPTPDGAEIPKNAGPKKD